MNGHFKLLLNGDPKDTKVKGDTYNLTTLNIVYFLFLISFSRIRILTPFRYSSVLQPRTRI